MAPDRVGWVLVLQLMACGEAEPSGDGSSMTSMSNTTGASTTLTTGSGGSTGTSSTTAGISSSTATSTMSSVSSDTSSSTSAGATTGGMAGGAGVLEELTTYLALPCDGRPEFESQTFASTPLSSSDARSARSMIWDDYAECGLAERQAEAEAKAITLGEHTLRYDYTTFGEEPATGHSLFISLHGGGEAEASVNDQQWENQKLLYEPSEGIYLAPRAPTNTWNLWHEPHIDLLFDRLISNFVVLEGVDPNRVYVMGYSAGGDGVYQLAPRMGDYWAAAAMMAGHPNDARPESLRNLGFTIHVGGQDTAYDRNLVAEEWGGLLDELSAADPEGYPHYVEVHPSKGHWMDLEDAVAVPWMADFTRNPLPKRIVWLQDDVTHRRFYWLAVDEANAIDKALIEASVEGQNIDITLSMVASVKLRLSDDLLDLDQPISVSTAGQSLFEGTPERTLRTLYATTWERGDPALVFSAEVIVSP